MSDPQPGRKQQLDPINAYLGFVAWFEQWENVRLKRRMRGKWIPTHQMKYLEGYNPRKYIEPYWEKIRKFSELRTLVLVEGCKLGASPVEMSRVLEGIYDAIRGLATWDRDLARENDELVTTYVDLFHKLQRQLSPLRDLLTWRAAREGETGKSNSSSEIEESTEGKALSLFFSNQELTVPEIAEQVGCTARNLYKLPRFSAAVKARREGRKDWKRGFRSRNGVVDGYAT